MIFLKIQIHPQKENFSTSELWIWMYSPDKTIPTNDNNNNFFLRLNIYTRVIVYKIEKSDLSLPFSRRSRKSFASVYVYKHTYNINTQFRTHNTRDQRASVIEFSFSRTVVEKHNEIFVSFEGETFVFYPENGAKKIVWATGEDDFARRGPIIKKKIF